MKGFEGLLGNPMFQAGMGILSANAPSLTPPNYMGGAMKGLMQGAQYAQQQKEMEMKKKLYDLQLQEAEDKRKANLANMTYLANMPTNNLTPEQEQTVGVMSLEALNTPPSREKMGRYMATQAPTVEGRLKGYELMQPEDQDYTEIVETARYLFPNDKEAQDAFIIKAKNKPLVSNQTVDPMDQIPSTAELLMYEDDEGNTPDRPMSFRELAENKFKPTRKSSDSGQRSMYVAKNLVDLEQSSNKALKTAGFDPTSLLEGARSLSNVTASEGYQKYKSTADEWATNMVFLRSGATARQEEKDSAFMNFWPQPGDKEGVVEFKERLRLDAMKNAYHMAGLNGRLAKEEADKQIEAIDKKITRIEAAKNGQVISDDNVKWSKSSTPPQWVNEEDRKFWDLYTEEEKLSVLNEY